MRDINKSSPGRNDHRAHLLRDFTHPSIRRVRLTFTSAHGGEGSGIENDHRNGHWDEHTAHVWCKRWQIVLGGSVSHTRRGRVEIHLRGLRTKRRFPPKNFGITSPASTENRAPLFSPQMQRAGKTTVKWAWWHRGEKKKRHSPFSSAFLRVIFILHRAGKKN